MSTATIPTFWQKIKAVTTKEEQLLLHFLVAAASAETSIQTAVEGSPLALAAVAAAEAHGVPVGEMAIDMSGAIAKTQKLVAEMAAPVVAPTAPPAA